MTITRIHQDGFEIGSTNLPDIAPWIRVSTNAAIASISKAYTGTLGLDSAGGSFRGIYSPIGSAITQMRTGFMMSVTSVADTPGIFFLASGDLSTPVLNMYFDDAANTTYLYAGATQLGNFVLDLEDGTWRHVGIDFKCDSSAGWCYVYIDGVEVLGYDGQTDYGDSDFDIFGLLAINATYDGATDIGIDDFYIDNSTGEVSPAPCTLKRFYPMRLNGTGNYAQWHGSDGDQTNNWDLIDSTTTLAFIFSDMIESQTSSHRDSWALEAAPVGITAGSDIVAVISCLFAQTNSVTDGVQITPFLRHSSTDDDGTAFTPAVGYEVFHERFLLDPSGSPWASSTLADLELGVKFE